MATGKDLRRMALALADTTEAPHFDRTAFKASRIYVTLAADGRTANFKFAPDDQEFNSMMPPNAAAPLPKAGARQGRTPVALTGRATAELKSALETAWAHGVVRKKSKRK